MTGADNFYYNQLGKTQAQVYHAMYTGLLEFAPQFSVPKLNPRELSDIYTLVRLDHPEIFCTETFKYRAYPQADSVEIMPEYMFKKDKLKSHVRAIQSRITKLIRPVVDKTDAEKQQFVHDFICQNVRYDKLKKAYSHEIIGVLTNGVGVCEGIAKTVKILCDALGLWCIIVISDNAPEKGIKYRHAWNIVRVAGKYCHMDATFDNTLGRGELVRYDYFNLCDRQIMRDHQPSIWAVPRCTDSDSFYYLQKKLSFTKMDDVAKRIAQNAKKDRPFVFHWRGGYLTREVLDELIAVIAGRAEEKGRKTTVSLNWPQSVLMVKFGQNSTLEIEDANEGEHYEEGEQ